MHHFQLKNGKLTIENLPVDTLAKEHGTPLYTYSGATLREHFRKLALALAPVDHLICYAMKANSNLAVLSLLKKEGAGFDIVSGGELYRVLKAGGDPRKCTFAGVGKTREEIEFALAKGIYSFNVESQEELQFINLVAGHAKQRAPVAIRVNPNVDAHTHSKITTGTYENKFGIAFEQIEKLYLRASKMKHIQLRGVQMHIGSQITQTAPFVAALKKMVPLVTHLRDRHQLEFFDIGGGIGIVYQPALESGTSSWWKNQRKPPMTIEQYANAIVPIVQPLGMKILVEPGRFITGNAGILIAKVLYVKNTGKKHFVIVDAAMNDLIRPAFYDSYHEIVPLRTRAGKTIPTDVVGPICESGDVFCKNRPLPPLKQGDFIAFMSAGAYGFAMSSNYNTRPRPAEILVRDGKAIVARRRETLADCVRGEVAE